MKIIKATPKKLDDGSWGATAKSASAQAGDMLDVVDTASGVTHSAMVDRVVYRGTDSAVCRIAEPDTKRRGVPDQCPACDQWLDDSDLLEADVAGYHVECC